MGYVRRDRKRNKTLTLHYMQIWLRRNVDDGDDAKTIDFNLLFRTIAIRRASSRENRLRLCRFVVVESAVMAVTQWNNEVWNNISAQKMKSERSDGMCLMLARRMW